MPELSSDLPLLEHTGLLEDLTETPAYLLSGADSEQQHANRYSCSFCGVGDTAEVQAKTDDQHSSFINLPAGEGIFHHERVNGTIDYKARVRGTNLELLLEDNPPLREELIVGKMEVGENIWNVMARRTNQQNGDDSIQNFLLLRPIQRTAGSKLTGATPTPGCMKLKVSMGMQRPVFPFHTAPSLLDPRSGGRTTLTYRDGIARLADLLLEHRPPKGRTLIYACGQIDYFSIFSFQEVFRLLGVRNLAGNAEHCLNAGAVHNEILTGQEGPFLTMEQSLTGENRFFLLNGWNGFITHPPAFGKLLKRKELDAYLVETVTTESARMLEKRIGPERILYVRSGSDPQLALAVAHEVLTKHPQAVEKRFIDQYADKDSFDAYRALAASENYSPESVSRRIAPEEALVERLLAGIRDIAAKVSHPDTVPINLPSVGLSQTKGAVAHCLWGSLLGMVGKYGLKADGEPAGGTLRIPGQVNAQTEVQGLSRGFFMGRIRMTEEGIREATSRMGLPVDAYDMALNDSARTALDYSDPTPDDEPELFICFGTQFESNMLGRARWIEKLKSPHTTLVVVDPIPDPFTVEHADLILPSPPHSAAAKLYQNGEWRISLSVPRKHAPAETRSDATIVYDAMAEISHRLRSDESLKATNPDLAKHVDSGYLQQRFEPPESGGGLTRAGGEVQRAELWGRIQEYMAGPEGALGPLYCRPEHADGRPITWDDLTSAGEIVYGGVGTTRYRLDYDDPGHIPFRDIFRRPGKFTFFVPTENDLRLPEGIILNSGRSSLSDDKKRVRFAVATFNSGKATTAVDMPEENPLFVSLPLAEELNLHEGDKVRVTGVESGQSLVLSVSPTDRVKGMAVYSSFHKSVAEIKQGRYLNDLTSHKGRCPYTHQSNFKSTQVTLEPLEA